MVDHDSEQEKNKQELIEFEKRVRSWTEDEINRKIKQWLRRIEQFVTLNKKAKGRKLYNEIKVMVKVLKEMAVRNEVLEEIAISTEDFGKPQKEVDLMNHDLSEFNMQDLVETRDILFIFPSSDDMIAQIYEICKLKFELLPIDGVEQINLDVAINEAIGNAQRHGHKYDPTMAISFRYIHTKEKLVMRVTDKGEGFDSNEMLQRKKNSTALQEARERYQSGGYGGLGIMMMLKCVNSVEYNEKGNQMTLTKHFQ